MQELTVSEMLLFKELNEAGFFTVETAKKILHENDARKKKTSFDKRLTVLVCNLRRKKNLKILKVKEAAYYLVRE